MAIRRCLQLQALTRQPNPTFSLFFTNSSSHRSLSIAPFRIVNNTSTPNLPIFTDSISTSAFAQCSHLRYFCSNKQVDKHMKQQNDASDEEEDHDDCEEDWEDEGEASVVIGPQYCAPYPVDLEVVKKVMTIENGSFDVTDINGNIVFEVKGSFLSICDHRVLVDAAGYPIVALRRKIMTLRDPWQAFRGESTDAKDLIFTLKRSSLFQPKTELDVFLANNTKEEVCDFKVKGSWFELSCIVYAGESNNIVAQMHKKHTVQSILVGKNHFKVTIYPNIDYAFIVALIVILDEINNNKNSRRRNVIY